MTDLSPSQRALLQTIAKAETSGGLSVPFVSMAHSTLEKAGLITIVRGDNPRVRCTAEGLEEANDG